MGLKHRHEVVPLESMESMKIIFEDKFTVFTDKQYELKVRQTVSIADAGDQGMKIINLYEAFVRVPQIGKDPIVLTVRDSFLSKIIADIDGMVDEVLAQSTVN